MSKLNDSGMFESSKMTRQLGVLLIISSLIENESGLTGVEIVDWISKELNIEFKLPSSYLYPTLANLSQGVVPYIKVEGKRYVINNHLKSGYSELIKVWEEGIAESMDGFIQYNKSVISIFNRAKSKILKKHKDLKRKNPSIPEDEVLESNPWLVSRIEMLCTRESYSPESINEISNELSTLLKNYPEEVDWRKDRILNAKLIKIYTKLKLAIRNKNLFPKGNPTMKSHIEIGGTTPADEDCANVGDEGYAFQARKEARVFINQIKRQFGKKLEDLIDDGRLELSIKSNPHDFGSYYDVVAKFEENDEVATNFAYQIENDVWTEWDDISRAELGLPILKSDADKHKEVQSNISKYKDFIDSFYNYTLYAEDEDGSIDFLSSDASGWKKNPTHFSIELLAFGDYTGDMVHKSNIKDMTELYEKLGLEPVTYDEDYSTETFLIKLTDLDNAEIKETLEGLKDYPLINDETHSELENEGKTELLQEFWNDHSEELSHMGYTEQSFLSDEELNDDIIFETGAVPFSKKLNELEDEVRSVDTDEPYKPKKKKNPTKKSSNDNESHLDEFIDFIEKNKKTYFSGTIMDIKETRRGHKEVWVELDKPIKVLASKINQGKFVVGELKVSKIPKDNGFDIDVGDRVEVRLYMSLGGVLIETIKLNKKKK